MAQQNGSDDGETGAAEPAMPAEPGVRRSTFTPAPAEAFAKFAETEATFDRIPADAPPPNPSTAVTPPPGSALPHPPQRRSMDDDELLSTLDSEDVRAAGALNAIEKLEAQLRIREQESREFRSWESSMLAIGTPEALEAVEETRTTFTGAIRVIPPAESADAEPVVYDLIEPEPAPPTTGVDTNPPEVVVPKFVSPEILTPEAVTNLDLEHDELDEVEPEDSVTDVMPPVAPVESPRTEPGVAIIIPDESSVAESAFKAETAGVDPTLPEHRKGRAFRLFWLWFAANSSVLSVVFGAMLLSLGMSLRQAIVATLAGVALSFLPIGIGTLASKWNGQPTMVASRASFGLLGNILPATLSMLTRLLWGAVLLWLLATITAALLVATGADGGLGLGQLTIATAAAGFLIALAIAFFGYRLLSRVQLVLSIASAVLVVVVISASWHLVDIGTALTIGDGSWMLVLTGLILVFSFVGLIWSTSAGDLARYQRPAQAGGASMLTASFGSVLPPFVLMVYGAVLAASDPALAAGFVDEPLDTLISLVPAWLLIPLIASIGIGLLSGVILSIYSGGFSLAAIAPLRRDIAVLLVGIVLGAMAVAFALLAVDFTDIVRDVATTLAVPTAAWLGIFAADIMVRNRRFDTRSLVSRGGVYPNVNRVNLALLVVATGIGYGLTTAAATGLAWQGYLLELVGVPATSELAQSDFGVLVALIVGLVGVIATGVPAIRRQEAART